MIVKNGKLQVSVQTLRNFEYQANRAEEQIRFHPGYLGNLLREEAEVCRFLLTHLEEKND